MKKRTFNLFTIIFLSLFLIGESFASNGQGEKNIGKFIPVSESGNLKDVQGASTAIVVSVAKGQRIGGITNPYTGEYENVWAGTINGTVDGNHVYFYCIDINHPWATGQSNPYTDEGETPIEVTYILNNYYPYVSFPYNSSLDTEVKEASAVQATIWHYVDGLDVSTIGHQDIRDRVNEIIADVEANSHNVVYPDYFTITPASLDLVDGTIAEFTISSFDTEGNPYSGLEVSLSTTSGTLSATHVVTDANGLATFALKQNGGNIANITASAKVTIAQGTQYFNIATPNKRQKMVLATPTVANAASEATVNWYTPGDCDLHNYTTFTQGGWGGPSNSRPGRIRDEHFSDVFPDGLTVGGHFTILLKTADDVKNFLPSGGTPSALTQNYVNPTSSTSAGNLAAQLVSVTLNIYFHDAGFLGTNTAALGDLVFDGGDFDGMSIYDFLTMANAVIGGTPNPNYTYSQINDAATMINKNFDDGTVNLGYFTCATTPPDCKSTIGDFVWHDNNVNGIQDNGELGIENVYVELYQDGNSLMKTITDNSGYYEFTDLANGIYVVKIADANFEAGGVFEGASNEKWYATYANKGNNDEVDSDGDEKNSAKVTIDCNDDFTIDFGFFHTCVILEKTAEQTVDAGELINYNFKVTNCGDIVLHGGATIYDPMINPTGNHQLANHVVYPGTSWNLTRSYTTTDADCGTLVNDAWVVGHPQMPDGSYKDNIRYDDSWSVEVVCNQKASIGDRVWFDDNQDGIQDFGEDGVKDVVVNLYTCAGAFVATANTDIDGYYLFEDLEVGSYYIEFVLPNGYAFSPHNVGNDSAIDSDADETTGKTVCTDLTEGEVDLTWDAGIYTVLDDNFDLTIEKTVSNTTPDDEAIITYTLTVTNNGTIEGTGIEVADILPAGLIYQSSSPAGYDTTTGVWTVGTLAAGASTSLDITVKVDYLSLSESPIFDLGIAAPYNLFVLRDVSQPHGSDTEGKVAVGRNAVFGNYSIGDKLAPSGGTEDVLLVKRKLTYTTGQVYNGNVVYGKYLDVQQVNLVTDGSIRKENNPFPIDFAQARTDLRALSSQLATRPVTGTTDFAWGGLTLTGNEPILNVFEVDGNDLSAANSMEINVPNGSVVVVNVKRRNISWTGGLVVNGTAIGNVIYNFYQAKKLVIQGIDIRGSVLAPKARVNFVSGVINGQMICNFFEGQGQMNNSLFHGSIQGNPEITNCAEITAVDQIEDSTDNNVSCAQIVVDVDYNPNNGNNNGNNNEWVEFTNAGLNEMIWSMYQSTDGLLVGTVGGHIYLNQGTDFVLLNDGMNATYIWSLYEFNGNIYAGTEVGLYKYDGTDWAKVSIDGDVRSITSLDDVLYAAVWGGGVFASNDEGLNWTAMNDGLEMSGYAVHSLTVADGNLFAGTFGLGILKYDFDNSKWVELDAGYQYVWSLATDADGTIYAGTYGGGALASIDNGRNWSAINVGLPNMYVYSVSTYGSNVYISTWAAGVYKFDTGSLTKSKGTASVESIPIAGRWKSIGMAGIEVSSVMVDEETQTLYAGTSNGSIYKMVDGTTDVNDNEIAPTEFALEQNYPNPFNPSTKIEFAIPKAGVYSLKVFNILGQEVAVLVNKDFAPGNYSFNFDASNLTSGIYFYKLVGENVNLTKKMILLK